MAYKASCYISHRRPGHAECTYSSPNLDVFARLMEAQLRSRFEPEEGIFIAESPKVIGFALDAGCEPISLLVERKHISGKARGIIDRCEDIPIYTQTAICWKD